MLAEAEERLGELQEKLRDLESENQSLKAQVDELTARASQVEEARQQLEERLASAMRVVEAMRGQLQASTQQVVRLESRNQLLGEENAKLRGQLERWQATVQQIQSLYRRQESLLTRLIRRYRDLTDYLRTVGLEVQNAERSGSGEQIDLSRIRSVLSLAEDDLQQLEAVNASLVRLQRSILEHR